MVADVAVLLPFRDAAARPDDAIASIIAQTFRNWELRLVDNASTDGGAAIARKWSRSDLRIRLLTGPRPGFANALNTGSAGAMSPLIARMDADDISRPDPLEKQVAYMNKRTVIGVLGARTGFSTSVTNSAGMRAFVNWQNGLITPQDHFLKRFVDAPLAHPTVMFRRELIDSYGGYSTDLCPRTTSSGYAGCTTACSPRSCWRNSSNGTTIHKA